MVPMFFETLNPVFLLSDLPEDAEVGSACYVRETGWVYVMTKEGWRPMDHGIFADSLFPRRHGMFASY